MVSHRMRTHIVPRGTQAPGVPVGCMHTQSPVGHSRGAGNAQGTSLLHKAKCHPRATACPRHRSLPTTHQAACRRAHGLCALPGLPGSTQDSTCPAVAEEGAQMPAQPFGPRCTRWDQITSESEMLVTHVLGGCLPPLAAWLCPCRWALLVSKPD